MKCYTASVIIDNTEEGSRLLRCELNMKKKHQKLRKTLFGETISYLFLLLCLQTLLIWKVCYSVCESFCYDRLYLFLWFCCNVSDSCVSSPIHSLITLDKRD